MWKINRPELPADSKTPLFALLCQLLHCVHIISCYSCDLDTNQATELQVWFHKQPIIMKIFANHVEANFIARWPKRSTTPLSTLSCFYFQVKLSSEVNRYFCFEEKSQIVCLRCWGRNKLLVKSIVFPLESIFCHKDDKIGSLSCLGTFAKIYCRQKFMSASSQRPLFEAFYWHHLNHHCHQQ